MRRTWNHTPPPQTQPSPPDNTRVHVLRQVLAWGGQQVSTGSDDDANWSQHIHPESAMEIAAWYQNISDPCITSFAGDGTIRIGLIAELQNALMLCQPEQVAELRALLGYIRAANPTPTPRGAHRA